MPPLSRKSSKQSTFPDSQPGGARPGAPANAPQGGVRPGLGPSEAEAKPVKKKKAFVLNIPFGFGWTLLVEPRFIGWCVTGSIMYLLAAFIGNEWMYLLSCSFLIAGILSVFLPWISLASVGVEFSLPKEVMQSDTADLVIKLLRKNVLGPISFLFPTRAIRISVSMVRRAPRGGHIEKILDSDPLYIESLDFDSLLRFPTPELRRGIYYLERIELTCCFPFGLVWWRRKIKTKPKAGQSTLTVLPRVYPISGNFLLHLKGVTSAMGLSASNSKIVVQSTSVRTVREFKTGDSIRHIHWPSSARTGKLLVRDFDSETLPVYDVVLDLRANWKTQDQFELAVTLVHSLLHLGHRLGTTPEIYLCPSLDSKILLEDLMFDLPQLEPGLELIAEILARVEPLKELSIDRGSEDSNEELEHFPDTSGNPDRPMLTIFASSDTIMKFIPKLGDRLVSPIELAVIPREFGEIAELLAEESELNKKDKQDKQQFKSARGQGAGSPGPRSRRVACTVGRPPDSLVIAHLDSESDLEPL